MRAAVLLGILPLLGATAAAQGASAKADLVTELEALADWCAKSKLIGSRNQVYEAILELRPDDATARKWLRYRIEDGRWVRPASYRPPADRNRDALPAFRERRRAIVDRYVARTKDAPLPVRQEALRVALAVDPDHAELRAAHGEVESDGAWLLRESVAARARRDELVRLAADSLENAPEAKPVPLTAEEKKLGLMWKGALKGDWWRFTGTTDPEEMAVALRIADASAPFLDGALPDPERPLSPASLRPRGYGMYYLTNETQGHELINAHPGFSAAERRFALTLSGAWVPRSGQAINWYSARVTRIDATARMAVAALLVRRYGAIDRGWVSEGFGLLLAAHLTGTRLVIFVEPSSYARTDRDQEKKRKLWDDMHAHGADWLQLARDLRREKPPDLRFLTGKRLNQITLEDLIHAHSLAAFLVQGHADRVSGFLATYAKNGHDLDAALESTLGLSLQDLEARLARWLEETR